MTKIFLAFPVLIILSCSSHTASKNKSASTYSINGKIDGRDTGWVFLGRDDTSGRTPVIVFDSAKISGSYFQFHGELGKPLMAKMIIRNKTISSYTPYFVLDTGITTVHLFNDSMTNAVITGTPMQDSLNGFNIKLYDLEISFDNMFALNRKGMITNDSLNKLQEAFYRNKHNLVIQHIKSNPSAITSAFVAQMILPDQPDQPTLEAVYKALDHVNNYYERHLYNVLTAKRQSRVGMQAASFAITDNTNRAYTNDSFRGKFLFLDFWASWCEPCREENPRLVKLYEKYANKGIEYVGISIDMDKRNWENAIKKDKLPWIQACDLKGSQSVIFKDFGLYDVPANFLIDQEGKIVAKNVTVEELGKILTENFGD